MTTTTMSLADVLEDAVGIPLAELDPGSAAAAADRLDAVAAALTPGPSAHDVHLLARLSEAAGVLRAL